jgi:16S rRNA (uracil1498-N3)-methyltransferase
MGNPRIYQDSIFTTGQAVALSDEAFGHTVRVLRLKEGDAITLFSGHVIDGTYGEYQAELVNVSKKSADASIISFNKKDNESPLNIHLGQGISRGDRMDFTLQKSVELGVNTITPIFTERCGVKLNKERLEKKHQQWQKIVISACEQSGRCIVPIVNDPISLQDWLDQETEALKINLHPKAQYSIMNLPQERLHQDSSQDSDHQARVRLLIGPEGGLTDEEIDNANKASFNDVLLGPRILRTETAALTAITALQCRFGDLT